MFKAYGSVVTLAFRYAFLVAIAVFSIDMSARADVPTFSEYRILAYDDVVSPTEIDDPKLLFGGRFMFAETFCGSPCQVAQILDVVTGASYSAPAAFLGYEYRPDSRLLIVNPGADDGEEHWCGDCTVEYWVWRPDKKLFLQIPPEVVSSPNNTDQCDDPDVTCE